MRWSISITLHAHRDKHRLLAGVPLRGRKAAAAGIDAAFRLAGNDPRRYSEMIPGNRWLRVLDHQDVRLILHLNRLEVQNPDDDRICWIFGVLWLP